MKEESQASTPQTIAYIKLDMMMKAMERLMDMLSIYDRGQNPNKERNETQIRNPNFRQPRQQVPQILQRVQRPQNDQVKPPFQDNFLENEGVPENEEDINSLGDKEEKCFLTKQDHYNSINKSELETVEYQKGYQNVMIVFQR